MTSPSLVESSYGASILKRNQPQIGGSFGGFIALIISLVLVIILTCAAVVYLLREEASSVDEERADRLRRGLYVSPPTPSSQSPYNYTPAKKPWTFRLKTSLGMNNNKRTSPTGIMETKSFPRSIDSGWLQASVGDDWEAETRKNASSPQGYDMSTKPILEVPNSLLPKRSFTPPVRPVVRSYPSTDSTSTHSVRFDLQNSPRGLSYPDRYAPSPQSTLPNIHTQLSSPTSSVLTYSVPLPRSTSPEHFSSHQSHQSHSDSSEYQSQVPQSAVSLRTFEGGTKFIEGF